jgi:hypothetical protein
MNLFGTAIIAVFATVLRKSRNGEEIMKRRHGLHYSWRLAMLSAVAFLTMAAASSTANAQPIVGLWEVTVTLTGQPVLSSFETWSSDGTQAETAIKPVLSGNVCLGLWTSLGKQSYGLTHPVYNFDDTGTANGTSANLMYRVTLSHGNNSFSGNASLTVFDGIDPFDPAATVLATFTGTVTAKRITVNKSQLP